MIERSALKSDRAGANWHRKNWTDSAKFCLLACAALFLAALARNWVSYDPSLTVPRDPESFALAHSLYETGDFANPFAPVQTGPSAHLAPVFPAFLELLTKIFGEGGAGVYAMKFAAALALALEVALFPLFSETLGMGKINGIIAALIWIVGKPRVIWGFEGLYVAILFAVVCCLYRRYLDEPVRGSYKRAWPLGILAGVLMLASQATAPVYATWLAWTWWHEKSIFLKKQLPLLALLPVVVIAPWTIRNYSVLHSFVLVRDNFGLELSVSNNDCARFGIWRNEDVGCFKMVHPNKSVTEAQKVKDMGEIGYNQLKLQEALNWITDHPRRFSKLSLMRFVAFWLPTETFSARDGIDRRLERLTIYLMTILSVPGLIILSRRDIKSAAVLISCLSVFPIVYYIIQFEDRYRDPIMWITFLLGSVPITAGAQRLWAAFSSNRLGSSADFEVDPLHN